MSERFSSLIDNTELRLLKEERDRCKKALEEIRDGIERDVVGKYGALDIAEKALKDNDASK